MNKLLAVAAIGMACAVAPTPVSAAVLSWNVADTGTGTTLDFNGMIEGVVQPGLTGSVNYTLDSSDGSTWVFSYTVWNTTSSPPWDDSRISGFGFNVDPNISDASVTGTYNIAGAGNVPGFGVVEFCAKDGGGDDNCAGGGGGGVSLGDPAGTGTFTLFYDAAITNVTLTDFYIRWQTLDSVALGFDGDSGIGVPNGPPIPEPETWSMMILGFATAGALLRAARRRGYALN